MTLVNILLFAPVHVVRAYRSIPFCDCGVQFLNSTKIYVDAMNVLGMPHHFQLCNFY